MFIIGGFFTHAGSDPLCTYDTQNMPWESDYREPDCEPNEWDELGYDFLDATGIPFHISNTIGFGLIRNGDWEVTGKRP